MPRKPRVVKEDTELPFIILPDGVEVGSYVDLKFSPELTKEVNPKEWEEFDYDPYYARVDALYEDEKTGQPCIRVVLEPFTDPSTCEINLHTGCSINAVSKLEYLRLFEGTEDDLREAYTKVVLEQKEAALKSKRKPTDPPPVAPAEAAAKNGQKTRTPRKRA